jgi:hypothetical protein
MMIHRLWANLSRWAYCKKCIDRTDQVYKGLYWLCLSCNSKVDRNGKVMK